MILMPQIFDVIANENARYKHNELELFILFIGYGVGIVNSVITVEGLRGLRSVGMDPTT